MSVSCVGTCSACGVRRFWLSHLLSLQMDDGSLKCLPHPGESDACEAEGLTLPEASQRGRLYRETFYVCHHCGRRGEIIEQAEPFVEVDPLQGSVWGATKIGLIIGALGVPVGLWFRWWEGVLLAGVLAVASPWITWRENRKRAEALAARGLPRATAPGRTPVNPPVRGCVEGLVIGRKTGEANHIPTATGPCCDQPDWRWSGCESDEDRIPCYACGRGVMTVSEQSIH